MINRIILEGRVFNIKYPEKIELFTSGQLAKSGGFLNHGLYCKSEISVFHIEDVEHNFEILIGIIETVKSLPFPQPMYLGVPDIDKFIPMNLLNIERDEEQECLILKARYSPSDEAMRFAIKKYLDSNGIFGPVSEPLTI